MLGSTLWRLMRSQIIADSIVIPLVRGSTGSACSIRRAHLRRSPSHRLNPPLRRRKGLYPTQSCGGTLGAIGGIRGSARFDMEWEDPVLERPWRMGMTVVTLPVVSMSARSSEQALASIADPAGEVPALPHGLRRPPRAQAADARMQRAKSGIAIGALDGAIVSITGSVDVKGEPRGRLAQSR